MPQRKKPNLTVALDTEGNWKHINEVESGYACNYSCPHCKARLIAINSKPETESKAHHFAHERGSDCKWSDESSLHKLAKEVLSEEKIIMLPLIEGETTPRKLEFDRVEEEYRDAETGLIPDCVCYYGDKKLWVEFKRTHEVDTKKAKKIRDAKIDCIEVDLNVCNIDKDAVRNFLKEESKNRIWVYNSKTNQEKAWGERMQNKKAVYSEHNYIVIDRHVAFDEEARLINLLNVDEGYDVKAHRYYCVSCGKELKIERNSFAHIEENKKCTDDIYLLKAAMEVIYYSFNNKVEYNVAVPQIRLCEKLASCRFADKQRCFAYTDVMYDLKKNGYTLCEKFAHIPGQLENYDIIIRNPRSLKNAIVVNLYTENCDRELNSGFRQIDIAVCNEKVVLNLFNALTGSCNKFISESNKKAKPEDIKAPVLKFSLFRSGKTYVGTVPCTELYFPRANSVVQEYLYQGEISKEDKVQLYALISCYEKKCDGCYCQLCYSLAHNEGYSPLCTRYKTMGTPRNPLEVDYPINCPHFGPKRQLITEVKEQCSHIKLIDLTSITETNHPDSLGDKTK